MKKIITNVALLLLGAAFCKHGYGQTVTTFSYTGATQSYTVPAGGAVIQVELWGAAGQTVGSSAGGLGGYVKGILNVIDGEVLSINVGGQTGFNGGGASGTSGIFFAGAGGGASDIRRGGTDLANRVAVAGGGGGAGRSDCSAQNGGNGGYPGGTGGNGDGVYGNDGTLTGGGDVPAGGGGCNLCCSSSRGGGGGGQAGGGGQGGYGSSSGGTGGACGTTNDNYSGGCGNISVGGGCLGIGGDGGTSPCNGGGGGGGGGYYGGGGGGANWGSGGGGGSSYLGTLTSTSYSNAVNSSDGKIVITVLFSTNPTQTNISCNGLSDGSVLLSPSGSPGPYTYSWSPGGSTNSGISGLAAGVYSCVVTCPAYTVTSITTVTQPNVLSATSTATNVSCYGGSNGAIALSTSGGTAAYSYSWLPSGGTAATATGLSYGSYTCTITDANNCTATKVAAVSQPTAALVASSTSGAIACHGGITTVTVTETGGTAPYSGDGVMSSVTAGSYTYTVTDNNSCTSTTTITVSEPNTLMAAAAAGTILCAGGTTTVNVTETGGTAPYSGDGVMSSVTAGSYTYTVTDNNSCTSTTTITIGEPSALIASVTSGTILCGGGTTTVNVTETGGTAPYSGDGVMSSVTAGSYTYTVTDNNGCTSTTTITIGEPSALVASSTSGTILCAGGTTTVNVTETGGTAPYSGDGVVSNVSAGTYSYTVTDNNSCTSTTTITISEPIAITNNQSFTVCAGASVMVGANTYSTTGTYTDVLTSAAGCDSTVNTNLTVDNAIDASVSVNGTTITSNETTSGATYQWVDCNNSDAPITGETNQSFTATIDGNYAVIVTVNSCSVTSSCTNITNTGIERTGSSNSINIYPNPSTGIFTIQSDKELGAIQVFDVLGRSIYSSTSKDKQVQLNLESHTPGIYYIKTNGSMFKIVKQ